ncbi:MAG: antibiotic biosynthesis monooxygenase family protein [Solirubrobacterales bacterium]
MLTVIFELWPNAGRREDYLGLAGDLRPELLRMDGFLGNERFESRREPGKMLALSFWRDEAALAGWRAHAGHRVAQARGRRDIFRDYRLRIGEAVDDVTDGAARAVSLVEVEPSAAPVSPDLAPDAIQDRETFESIYNPGKLAVVLSWRDMAAAGPWLAHPDLAGPGRQHRLMRVVRDYGLTRRDEAPYRPAA